MSTWIINCYCLVAYGLVYTDEYAAEKKNTNDLRFPVGGKVDR